MPISAVPPSPAHARTLTSGFFLISRAAATPAAVEAAVSKADSLDREKIRDALAALDTVTVYGHYKVDKDGQQIGHDVLLVQWQHGKKKIVWPDRYATAKLIYPVPSWQSRR